MNLGKFIAELSNIKTSHGLGYLTDLTTDLTTVLNITGRSTSKIPSVKTKKTLSVMA